MTGQLRFMSIGKVAPSHSEWRLHQVFEHRQVHISICLGRCAVVNSLAVPLRRSCVAPLRRSSRPGGEGRRSDLRQLGQPAGVRRRRGGGQGGVIGGGWGSGLREPGKCGQRVRAKGCCACTPAMMGAQAGSMCALLCARCSARPTKPGHHGIAYHAHHAQQRCTEEFTAHHTTHSSTALTCGSRAYLKLSPGKSSGLGRSPLSSSCAMSRSRRGRAASALCRMIQDKSAGTRGGGGVNGR